MASPGSEPPRLMQLKDLIPLRPWRTPPPPFTKLQGVRYMKLKEPIYRDGVRVYWQPKVVEREADDPEIEIPYEGFFEFVEKYVVNVIKRWIDRVFGQVFSLPRPDCDLNSFGPNDR